MSELNLLGISLDETLAVENGTVQGDSLIRIRKQGEMLSSYHLVVRTRKRHQPSRIQLASNVVSYPTSTRFKANFLLTGTRLGARICSQYPISLVYTQDPFTSGLVGYFLKLQWGLPLCLSFAGDMIDNRYWLGERIVNPFMNTLGKWLIHRADSFRVVSCTEKEKLMRLGVASDRIWIVGWITDFSRFSSASGTAIRSQYLAMGFSEVILFCGRFVRQKDLPTLLSAVKLVLRKHPRALLLMVGDGPEKKRILQMADSLGLSSNIRFQDGVSYDDIAEYFAACDVLVLSSRYEGNARVLAEAGAACKPVVATDVSGTRDTVIDGVTGHVVACGDVEAFADATIKILENPEKARAMGRRARVHVLDSYDDDRLLRRFQEMWQVTASRYRGL